MPTSACLLFLPVLFPLAQLLPPLMGQLWDCKMNLDEITMLMPSFMPKHNTIWILKLNAFYIQMSPLEIHGELYSKTDSETSLCRF